MEAEGRGSRQPGRGRRAASLSKSRYISGLQCPLKLWRDCYEPDLAPSPSEAVLARFATGEEVGRLATSRHSGGVLVTCDHLRHPATVKETREAMGDARVPAIFEAGFVHEHVKVRVDILARAGGGAWDLVEVKSATSVKPPNLDDVSVQAWVLEGCGVRLGRVGVLTLNRDYVYAGGDYDVQGLFTVHDLTDVAASRRDDVSRNVERLHGVLRATTPPTVQPGPQCTDPYECPYIAYCTQGMAFPEHPVTDLPRLGPGMAAQLHEQGIEEIANIPDTMPLTELQQRVRTAVVTGQQIVGSGLRRELQSVRYPVHHLDFETFAPALPRYPGTRPYQLIPFQWSDHVEHKDGTIEHREYLSRSDEDPRRELVRTLLHALGEQGTICIYTTYEVRVLRELAEALPRYRKRLAALEDRCWDLCQVIRDHYYHPAFHGSFSLKRVLPVLVPHLGYGDLQVQDGDAAWQAYQQAILAADPALRAQLFDALVAYCGRDTEALVAVRGALQDVAQGRRPT